MAIALPIAEVELALVFTLLAVLLPMFKQKPHRAPERYLPYFGLVLLAMDLVGVVDDIHARKPYLVQLVIAAAPPPSSYMR